MNLLMEFFASMFATIGFAYNFSCPKKTIFLSGISGAVAWIALKLALQTFDKPASMYLGNFIGAFLVGAMGEIFARIFKTPSSIFIIPGITTLCPGAAMYYSILYFAQGNPEMATNKIREVMAIAVILAFGLLISSLSSRSLKTFKRRKYIKFDYRKTNGQIKLKNDKSI